MLGNALLKLALGQLKRLGRAELKKRLEKSLRRGEGKPNYPAKVAGWAEDAERYAAALRAGDMGKAAGAAADVILGIEP
jgi:hypothetical protein